MRNVMERKTSCWIHPALRTKAFARWDSWDLCTTLKHSEHLCCFKFPFTSFPWYLSSGILFSRAAGFYFECSESHMFAFPGQSFDMVLVISSNSHIRQITFVVRSLSISILNPFLEQNLIIEWCDVYLALTNVVHEWIENHHLSCCFFYIWHRNIVWKDTIFNEHSLTVWN